MRCKCDMCSCSLKEREYQGACIRACWVHGAVPALSDRFVVTSLTTGASTAVMAPVDVLVTSATVAVAVLVLLLVVVVAVLVVVTR